VRNTAGALLIAASAPLLAGCGGGEKQNAVDVTEACDRLADLGEALLSVGSATTAQQVKTAIDEPLAAFVTAASDSGDERLTELAATYETSFGSYLEGEGLDAREAGNEADVALDRAGQRCMELGASNDFLQEP
jgi:hypothetical protein